MSYEKMEQLAQTLTPSSSPDAWAEWISAVRNRGLAQQFAPILRQRAEQEPDAIGAMVLDAAADVVRDGF